MPSLIRKEKVSCEHYGTQVTRQNLLRHKKRCSAGILYSTQCPNFSTLSQGNLKHHVAKKHSVPRHSITYKCKLCYAEFPGFCALRQHKSTRDGTQISFRASNIDVEDIVGDVDDQSLREELESCKHFLSDTEIEILKLLRSFQINLLIKKMPSLIRKKNYLRTLWNPSCKKQYCTAQKEMFSWNLVLYAVSQFLYKIKR